MTFNDTERKVVEKMVRAMEDRLMEIHAVFNGRAYHSRALLNEVHQIEEELRRLRFLLKEPKASS
jgi:hypothetical protein